jgi:hypothetical protein
MSADPPEVHRQAEEETTALRPEVASILATEHWSLLGTRSMTWSEVMSRITIYLTVVSAFLVVLALTANATGFGTPFMVMSIGFAATALILGTLTGMRVAAASQEDAQLVRAMNRLRRAYVDIAPEVGPYLTASTYDDDEGLMATYSLGRRRRTVLQIVASTLVFVSVVNTLVAGTLTALIASAVGISTPATVIISVIAGVGYLAVQLEISRRLYAVHRDADVRFPSLPPSAPQDLASAHRRRRGSPT